MEKKEQEEEISFFGKKAKESRKEIGITLAELSDRIETETGQSVSTSSLQRFETSKILPSFDIACSIAHVLKLDIMHIYRETLKENSSKPITFKRRNIRRDMEELQDFLNQFGLSGYDARKAIRFYWHIEEKINELNIGMKRGNENGTRI